MRRIVWIVLGIGLVAGAGWGARAAWRAHKDLVTVHVRNEPVAKVARAMARQTWETILVDSNLTGRVTLDLVNVPLREALDRLAEKAGALATTVHAVYRSTPARHRLEIALQAGADDPQTGWTNLAPVWAGASTPVPATSSARTAMGGADLPEAVQEALKSGQFNRPGLAVALSTNVGSMPSTSLGAKDGTHSSGRMKMVAGGPVIVMHNRSGKSGETTQTTIWSPERLALETALLPRLKQALPQLPSPSAARQVAGQVAGRYAKLYALKRAPFATAGLGLGGGGGGSLRFQNSVSASGSATNLPALGEELGARLQREKLAQFEELTPEERVQRARQLRVLKPN